MDAKRFFNYFQTDKSKSPANEGQQIEKPVKTEPVEAKSEQSEAKSENPKMQQLSPAFARSEGEDGVRSSIKRKLSESPVMSRSKSDHPESDQSTMKNSETSTKEISSSSTDAIEIDEESTGMDTSQSDDKRERSKRALRDRSKLKTKSLKSRVVFSSDDDSDYVLEDSEDSNESEESDEWNSDEDEDDYRKVTKRSRTNGYRSSFNRSNESKGEKAEGKCEEKKLKDEGISETGPVDYRPTVCVVDGGKKIPLQVASVNTKQDSSAVGSAVGSAVSSAVGPAVSSAASSGVSLLADRKPGDEYSFVNDTGLKIVYGVEYKPSE